MHQCLNCLYGDGCVGTSHCARVYLGLYEDGWRCLSLSLSRGVLHLEVPTRLAVIYAVCAFPQLLFPNLANMYSNVTICEPLNNLWHIIQVFLFTIWNHTKNSLYMNKVILPIPYLTNPPLPFGISILISVHWSKLFEPRWKSQVIYHPRYVLVCDIKINQTNIREIKAHLPDSHGSLDFLCILISLPVGSHTYELTATTSLGNTSIPL